MYSQNVAFVRANEHDYEYQMWHEDLRIGYAHSMLTREGITAGVFDYAMKPLIDEADFDNALSDIHTSGATVIIFAVEKAPTNSPFYTAELIERVAADMRFSGKSLVLYGLTAVGSRRFLRDLPLTAVVTGEEDDLVAVVKCLLAGICFDGQRGVVFRDATNTIKENAPSKLRTLDSLPLPYRYYFENVSEHSCHHGYVGGLFASRGCYASCTFCYLRAYDAAYGSYPWRGRDPHKIADEMAVLYEEKRVREFAFLDPNFFGPGIAGQKWAMQLAEAITKHKMRDASFSLYARANDMHAETLGALKHAGLYAVFIGIESFSDRVLKRYRKGTTVAQNWRAIDLLMSHDIRLRMGFIMFDEITNDEEIQQNLAALREIAGAKPHLITQPLFFNNLLVPLEDTPSETEPSIAVESISEALARQQVILSRGNASVRFSSLRVASFAEAVRLISSELLQRSTALENKLSTTIRENSSVFAFPADAALSWFDGLTDLCIGLMCSCYDAGYVTEDLRATQVKVVEYVRSACRAYDTLKLGYPLHAPRDSVTQVFN